MKKLSVLLLALVFVACEGDPGPMGPEGPPGTGGVIGQAFEAEVDFTEGNGYSQIVNVPSNIEIYESDIVAVYLLWAVEEGSGYDVWQPLPVSHFFDDGGEMQYAFDHTVENVQLFLTGDINLGTLGNDFTQDQIFRIVVLPAEYVQANKINMSNMNEVMKAVDVTKMKRLQLAK